MTPRPHIPAGTAEAEPEPALLCPRCAARPQEILKTGYCLACHFQVAKERAEARGATYTDRANYRALCSALRDYNAQKQRNKRGNDAIEAGIRLVRYHGPAEVHLCFNPDADPDRPSVGYFVGERGDMLVVVKVETGREPRTWEVAL